MKTIRSTVAAIASRLIAVAMVVLSFAGPAVADDRGQGPRAPFIKLEAENFDGFGAYSADDHQSRPKVKEAWTPRMAWYPQWSRGGDSGWWAAQGAAGAASGEISIETTIPESGTYVAWVRYEDYLGQAEPFKLIVKSAAGAQSVDFGRTDVVTTQQPPFAWSYAWDKRELKLAKGPATVVFAVDGPAKVRRGIDCVVLTTSKTWTPKDRGFPPYAYAEYLTHWGATRTPLTPLVPARKWDTTPKCWELPKTAGRDFWYLGAAAIAPGFPLPITIRNQEGRQAFVKAYAAAPDKAPVFGSPITGLKPGPAALPSLLKPDSPLRKYILRRKYPFVLTGNYASFGKITNSYPELIRIYGDLWVGIISGEGSYLHLPTRPAPLPRSLDFKELTYAWFFKEGRMEWQKRLSADWASPIANPFERFILCQSVATRPLSHRIGEAGTSVIGAESASAMPYVQNQMAFVRGAARQYGARWLWYWGASFGDAIRSFIKEPYFLNLE